MAETTLETKRVSENRPDTVKGWMEKIAETPTTTPLSTPSAPPPNALSQEAPAKIEPVPEPKKEAVAAKLEESELPDDKWPRSAQEWKNFKASHKEKESTLAAERDALKKERDDLSEKMKTLSSVTDAAEYKALKQERDDMDKILRTANIRDNPKFKSYFDSKTNAQIDLAKRIVGNDKGEQMARLLQLPDGDWKNQQIRDFMAEFDVMEQSRIGGVLNSMTQIEQERQSALQVADKDYESMTTAQKEKDKQAQEAQQKNIASLIDRGITAITDPSKGHPVFQRKEGDTAWNTAVEKRVDTVKQLLTGVVPPEKIFETAVNAVAYHQVLESHKSLVAENATLKKQVEALTSAQPSMEQSRGGGGNSEPQIAPPKPGSRPMDLTTNWVQNMRKAQEQG